jgi:predicted HAD superfamily Cof-like phosphohydrolase
LHSASAREDIGPTGIVDDEVMEYRRAFMQEELDEVMGAWRQDDLAGVADGLVDLVYVALGTAHLLGLPWQHIWDAVQEANMAKERATSADDERSTRKSSLDVVKPEGWQPPDVAGVLRYWGFDT